MTEQDDEAGEDLVVLAAPVARTAERVAARFGDLREAPVVPAQGRPAAPGRAAAGAARPGDDRPARGRRQCVLPGGERLLRVAGCIADGCVHGVAA